jgi:type VI secretion system protein ImpG
MSETLDGWYQRELDYFRSNAAEFARKYPKIAGRLSMGATGTRDPHVERLIQAFALMNARIRQKLDDGFPELVDAMLSVLYPHMLAPVPSMSVIQFAVDQREKDLLGGHVIAPGTLLVTERIGEHASRFRTSYPVTLYSCLVDRIRIFPRPFSGPSTPRKGDAQSVLRITLQTLAPDKSFANFDLDHLRFYVAIPNFEKAAQLIELVTSQALEVVIRGSDADAPPHVLSPEHVVPVGFAPEDAILPGADRSFPGYRLLTEYFVLPQKFLFFDVTGLTPAVRADLGNTLEISILLNEHVADLEAVVSEDTVKLGCTPIVNLFSRTADAISLNYRAHEYRVIPDARAEDSLEIYSVDRVAVEDQQGEIREFRPFYSLNHSLQAEDTGYWHALRRPGPVEGDRAMLKHPTEVYVNLVDPDFSPLRAGQGVLYADVTCFNRDLPEVLAERGSDSIQLEIVGGRGPVARVQCMTPPTPTFRRHLGRRNLWPLISQLSLNHLSILNTSDAVDALREMLTLNDPKESVQTRNLINGLTAVSAGPCVERLGEAFVRGTEVHLTFDDEKFRGDSAYLFASTLARFFSMYTSLNSFVRLSANTMARQNQGVRNWTWQAEIGNRFLV